MNGCIAAEDVLGEGKNQEGTSCPSRVIPTGTTKDSRGRQHREAGAGCYVLAARGLVRESGAKTSKWALG